MVCCTATRDDCEACAAAAKGKLKSETGVAATQEWHGLPHELRDAYTKDLGDSEERASLVARLALCYERPQRALWCALACRRKTALYADLPQLERAILNASGDVLARSFWIAPPLLEREHPTDDVTRTALCDALGVLVLEGLPVTCPVAPTSGATQCAVAASMEAGVRPECASEHARVCKHGGLSWWVHENEKHAVTDLLRSWGLSVVTEWREGMLPGSQLRVDTALRGAGAAGRTMLGDVTRADLASYARKGHVGRGVAAELAVKLKLAKYLGQFMEPNAVDFYPMAHDSHGGTSKTLRAFVEIAAARAATVTGGHPVDLQRTMWATIARENVEGLAWQYAKANERTVLMRNVTAAPRAPNKKALELARTARRAPYIPFADREAADVALAWRDRLGIQTGDQEAGSP